MKMIAEVEVELAKTPQDLIELEVLSESLRSLSIEVYELDKKIKDVMLNTKGCKEQAYADEVEDIVNFKKKMEKCKIQLEKVLNVTVSPGSSSSNNCHVQSPEKRNVKLPKIELKKYGEKLASG